jgi:creatinine amidohydrolase
MPGSDAHAGRFETSVMLALAPDSVRLDLAVRGDVRPLAEIMPMLRAGGVRAVSRSGVLGDPAGASPADGARLLESLAARLGERIDSVLAETT